MSVSISFAALPGVGISSACGWPHARAPACIDQHCSPHRLFDLLGTPRKGRTDPFMRYVVEQQCVEDNADPSLLPKKAWWGLWFSWTGQTPDSLLLNRLAQGLRTLPSIDHEVSEGANAKAQSEAEQADEVAASSSTALEIVKKDKRTLTKEAAEGVDTLLLEQVQNKNRLGIEDRKKDLHLIKSYQEALRAVHVAPDPVFGTPLGLGAGVGLRRLRQASQSPIVELTQPTYPVSATLSEIDDEDSDYELVSDEVPSSRSRATTVEEVFDEEEPIGRAKTLFSQKDKARAIEPAEEKTFRQAWEELKVMADGIKEIAKPEDSLFQKTCLTILIGFDRFLGFIPFMTLAVGAIRSVCYEARALRQEAEWRNRNAVRKALIEISAPILAAPDEEELDMKVADVITSTIKQNSQIAINEMGENLATAHGLALQHHADNNQKALAAAANDVTNTVTSHIDKRLSQITQAQQDAKDIEIARLRAENAQQAATIANLAAAMNNMNNVNRNV